MHPIGNKFFHLKWLILLIAIATTWVNLNQERWLSRSVIDHDVAEYYIYLPAAFIEHDLSLSFANKAGSQTEKIYWIKQTSEGRNVAKMTMGTAVSYLPFFVLAHGYALLTGGSASGFSEPYQFAIQFSSLFYFVLGVFFLWKFMRLFFSDTINWLAILCITFGTNVFYYLTVGAGLSHPVGFFLYSSLLFYVFKWRDTKAFKQSILIGLIIGFMALVRPINALASVLVFLLLLNDFFKNKFSLTGFSALVRHLFVMAVFALLAMSPQLVYWKFATGHFFFNSYMEEGFYFSHPHLADGLFGFRKGWFIYTPLALIATAGLFFNKKEGRFSSGYILLFLLLYVYVCFSWWCWWYGGSFGQRAMIDVYPLLTPGLARLFKTSSEKSKVVFRAVAAATVLLVLLNLFQTMQAKYNIIHYDSMTREAYMDALFRTTKNPDREKFLKHPDYEKALKGEHEE